MYYSSGNYESLSHPEKAKNIDSKSAYIIGTGLAGLSAAAFLIRDCGMKGERIHMLEEEPLAGGVSPDLEDSQGFVIRSSSVMEEHFECLWDLFSTIPSSENNGLSVLDEFKLINEKDPNQASIRTTTDRCKNVYSNEKYNLSNEALYSLIKLILTKDEELADKRVSDVLDESFFSSNLWLYFQTLFAFSTWHSALEMKRFLLRFAHQAEGFSNLSSLKYAKYNQYESFILPLVKYLTENGVDFVYNTRVSDVKFEIENNKMIAKSIALERDGTEDWIGLTEDDLLFITNGSATMCASLGAQDKAAARSDRPKKTLWMRICDEYGEFGSPAKFFSCVEKTRWEAATITTLDEKIPQILESVLKRDPFSGKLVTGGLVTIKDSSWLLSFAFNRQPYSKIQARNELVGWIYGLNLDKEGDFIHKRMYDCTGTEICAEWLYHMGVDESDIMSMARESANTIPIMLPYITSSLMPRTSSDRPRVVPEKAKNFAFIGQFAETDRDVAFTPEYSVRTAMEAVYTLLSIDKGVPEVWSSAYDIRSVLAAIKMLLDGRKLVDLHLPFIDTCVIEKTKGTVIYDMLESYNLI